jgi:uncharacterized repeat protein (TIGR03803 family)
MYSLSRRLLAIRTTFFFSLTFLSLLTTSVARAHAQTVDVLHNFGVAAGDGDVPYSGLTEDAEGNLYGTTSEGGTFGFGTVFRLAPTSSGDWEETVLYHFKGGTTDGAFPHAPLFRDSAGNLYSTTVSGGIQAAACTGGAAVSPGCGVVYKLTPTTTGEWRETVLFRFTAASGGNPFSGLVQDKAGNFYGATLLGGAFNQGTVYKLSDTSEGWKATVLHSFKGGTTDGTQPYNAAGTLALDSAGNVYGSTLLGGTANAGTVFKLIRPTTATGIWTEKILHMFLGTTDGYQPLAGVILDKSGNVYGTTTEGGTGGVNGGTVFKLTAAKNYAKTVLHDFSLRDKASTIPTSLLFDASGNLWGTTAYGVFKLTPSSTGWAETVLWGIDEFPDSDGTQIYTPILLDEKGNIFGTTLWGGTAGSTTGGVAYKLIP